MPDARSSDVITGSARSRALAGGRPHGFAPAARPWTQQPSPGRLHPAAPGLDLDTGPKRL